MWTAYARRAVPQTALMPVGPRASRNGSRLAANGSGPGRKSPGGIRDNTNLAVDRTPDEIRRAEEILRARQAVADAHRILDEGKDEDEGMRRQFGPLLTPSA
jgi:hypothetical protein